MKRPSKIKIGQFTFHVDYVPTKDIEGNLGRNHGGPLLIECAKDVHEQQIASTLFHEALHGIMNVYYIEGALGLSTTQGEHLVRMLEVSIIRLLEDNPGLVEYIQKTQRETKSDKNGTMHQPRRYYRPHSGRARSKV